MPRKAGTASAGTGEQGDRNPADSPNAATTTTTAPSTQDPAGPMSSPAKKKRARQQSSSPAAYSGSNNDADMFDPALMSVSGGSTMTGARQNSRSGEPANEIPLNSSNMEFSSSATSSNQPFAQQQQLSQQAGPSSSKMQNSPTVLGVSNRILLGGSLY